MNVSYQPKRLTPFPLFFVVFRLPYLGKESASAFHTIKALEVPAIEISWADLRAHTTLPRLDLLDSEYCACTM